MKALKISLKALFVLILLQKSVLAWTSESGGGVVSANENIVRASLEATLVLQSDTSSILYGTTKLGGATSFSSYDSSGVEQKGSISASNDVTWLKSNQYTSWVTTKGKTKRVGLQANDVFLIDNRTVVTGTLSADGVNVTSINTTNVKVSGNPVITSTYTTGTCIFAFNNGILQTASC